MGDRDPWFADRGGEKMFYDLRMGPQVVLHQGYVYAVFQAGDAQGPSHPFVVRFRPDDRSREGPFPIGRSESVDHHFAPILWFDHRATAHVIYHCHSRGIGRHVVSTTRQGLGPWQAGPEIPPSVSYPRVIPLGEGQLVLYYRIGGHLGRWGYRLSWDGGYTWSHEHALVDFDLDPSADADAWAGTYHAVCPSKDRTALHVGFVYWDERRAVIPLYGEPVGTNDRHHLYYLRVDLETGAVRTLDGRALSVPVNRRDAESCKLLDTGDQLTNFPSIAEDDTGVPSFLLPVSGTDSPWDCRFVYVRPTSRGLVQLPIVSTSNTWDGCLLRTCGPDALEAVLVVGRDWEHRLAYGGGSVEIWRSEDGGGSWRRTGRLDPVPGHLYNNPRPVERVDGTQVPGALAFFGWDGPGSIEPLCPEDVRNNRGRAFLWYDGAWL